jgi:hypothetical protein
VEITSPQMALETSSSNSGQALRGGLLADDCELHQARPAAPVVFRDVNAEVAVLAERLP